MSLLEGIARRAIFQFDPETAHGISIRALKSGIVSGIAGKCRTDLDPRLSQSIAGLDFANPIGLAAGYDKNAEVPDAILQLGFGFTEIGTVTPRAQAGNPKPRIFRLPEDHGVINRLGFNNHGHLAALALLEARQTKPGIVGINIGANKDSEDFVEDYCLGIKTFCHLASYFTVNISSPNTPGLRNLQTGDALMRLLDRVFDARDKASHQPPVFLKLAPDLMMNEVDEISATIEQSPLAAVMISNTTLARNDLKNLHVTAEAGGLSGRPLFERSTVMLARFRERLPASLPLIGIGGVENAETAWHKFEAGASLVQLYTGMIYQGPCIANNICQGLSKKLDQEKIARLSDLVGRKTRYWASKNIEKIA